jgi:hypothetical protein
MNTSFISSLRALPILLLTLLAGGAEAGPLCKQVKGTLDIIPVLGPECTAATGICGRGSFKGDLQGPYASTLDEIIVTADTPKTGVVLITGGTALKARVGFLTGTLNLRDSGAFKSTGNGEFAEIFSVVSGTGWFENATGTLTVTGSFTVATGGGGDFKGEICLSSDRWLRPQP